MAQFLVLPRDTGDAFRDLSPSEIQEIIQRYVAWGEKLKASGHYLAGAKLRDGEGRVLKGNGSAAVVTDGPYSETKEVIGGYWLIEAKDYDEATALAKRCPHLEFGTLEVRATEET